jgi:hypothetical protein
VRLSEWRAVAPHPASIADKVLASVAPVLDGLGAETDPACWIAWGDDPTVRYTILAIADAGLVTCSIRVNVPQEGPRASGKLVRWSRLQVGELSVENQGGHSLVSFQVESQLLRGVDDEGHRVTEFALDVLAGVDGRPLPSLGGLGASPSRAVPALPPGGRA